MTETIHQILPGLWRFEDTCNVYVVQRGDRAIAIDFGSGSWLQQLPNIGIQGLDHVFLTHHHADQCSGLQAQPSWPFLIHAPVGESKFLDPAMLARGTFDGHAKGCPDSYSVLAGGILDVHYNTMVGFTDFFWGDQRIRFLHSPGHGPNACSVILDHDGKQVVFCGDAAHSGGTVWQPYHLEWDHWTGTGVLAAWEGVERLRGVGMDLLCPSHGPVVIDRPRAVLKQLADRLLKLYQAKGQIALGENDDYLAPIAAGDGYRQVLPSLFQFGTNGYLLAASSGEALIVDPFLEDMPALAALLNVQDRLHPTAAVATHYHLDHCDALPVMRERYSARIYLHPWVAAPLRDIDGLDLPWLPEHPIFADELWPEEGDWQWNEYQFRVAPFPGQTRWHGAFMTEVGSQHVLFGGDSFQPSSRWNGTGGFCAYNVSRFAGGFTRSAQMMREWQPDILACGHGTYYRFHAPRFRKIMRWSKSAEKAVADVCPSGILEQDYYVIDESGHKCIDGPGSFFWANARL